MKFLLALLLSLSPAYCSGMETRGGFVETNRTHFVVAGKRLYLNGFNAYWMMVSASDAGSRADVTLALQKASGEGMNVARTWAFNDGGYMALQLSPGSYNERVFRGLDFVVAEAGRCKVYLILSLVNNYDDFGGRKKYVQWANLSDPDEFYTNSLVRQFYKNHIKAVLTRNNTLTGVAYKDDPTILAWELMNEPRSQDPSCTTIQEWVEEMAAYVKSIDGNHLLEIGLEGFYGGSVPERKEYNPNNAVTGTDFILFNQISHVDFATIHLYPEQWLPCQNSSENDQNAFADKWIQAHIEDCDTLLKKPLVIGEFGKSYKSPGFTMQKRDNYFERVYNAVYASASNGGSCTGAIFWQLMTEGTKHQGDGYEVVLEESESTSRVIAQQSSKLGCLAK